MRLYEQNAGAVVRKRKTAQALRGTAYPDFLMHYGIIGQKWGIRRFQNEDGTLTEEGKLRYNEGSPESETWRKNEAEHLTDAELRRRTSRLQMERQYKDLTTSEVEREKNRIKKDIIQKALIIPVVAVAGILGKHYISSHADKIIKLLNSTGKTLLRKIRSPIARVINKKNLGKQTLDSTVDRAASRYEMNRPPLGTRQYYPQTMFEIFKKKTRV